MRIVLSLSRRRNSINLLRRFSVDIQSSPLIKPESQESVISQFVENLWKIPQNDWASNESLGSLLASSSTVSPLVFLHITRRLGSYSLAFSFFEYLNSKSQSLNRREESLSLAFQSVIEFAGIELDSKDKLLRLYEIAQEKKIRLNSIATKHLIREFGRYCMVNQSILVYKGSNTKTTQIRNVLIDVLLRNGRVDDAFKVLDEMLRGESVSPPDNVTAEIVFKTVWRGRRFTEKEIVELISRFGSHGVSPNITWLTRFVNRLCNNGCVDVAWGVLSDLMKKNAPLEARPFNAVLTCLGRRVEIGRMNDIAVKMDEMKIRPDVVTLGIFINTLCKLKMVDEALEVFETMRGKQIEADSIHFNTLIDGFCKVGRIKEAEELVVRMKMEEGCAPNRVTYNCLIGGYCRTGQVDTGKEVVSRMKEDGITPDVVTLNTIVGGMCRNRGVNLAVVFLSEMQREGLKANVITYMTLIHAYCNVGNIEKAMQLFDVMIEDGCSPDAKIYYALISGLCQARRDLDAIRVVEKLKQARLAPDLLAYNMLIGLFCETDNVEKVYEMLNDMEGAKMKPDSFTYNILISFFGKQKDFDSVQKLMEEMIGDGFIPVVVTYGAIITAYCSAGETDKAMKIFKDMGLHSKINPNTRIYNILINAYCKLDNLEQALALKEEMEQKMVRPDVETYNALFRCLKYKSQVETLLKLMDEMQEHSCEPNHITRELLMERLSDSDQLDKLKQFLEGYIVASRTVEASPLPFFGL